jgi:hypothetical protein
VEWSKKTCWISIAGSQASENTAIMSAPVMAVTKTSAVSTRDLAVAAIGIAALLSRLIVLENYTGSPNR